MCHGEPCKTTRHIFTWNNKDIVDAIGHQPDVNNPGQTLTDNITTELGNRLLNPGEDAFVLKQIRAKAEEDANKDRDPRIVADPASDVLTILEGAKCGEAGSKCVCRAIKGKDPDTTEPAEVLVTIDNLVGVGFLGGWTTFSVTIKVMVVTEVTHGLCYDGTLRVG